VIANPTKNKSLEASCTVLITVCELYKSVVSVPSNASASQTISIPKLLSNIRTARITFRHAFYSLQALAVSPSSSRDRQDWFPAFLSACNMAVAAIIFIDVLVLFPSPYREQIWGSSWHDTVAEMRNGGYGLLIAMLRANSKGVNPLKLDCWADTGPKDFINYTPSSYEPSSGQRKRRKGAPGPSDVERQQRLRELEAQRERNVLLGINSPAALQGVLALKGWYTKYGETLQQGEHMFSNGLYHLATVKPIAGLWRIFELK
jgi:hypothetical protein